MQDLGRYAGDAVTDFCAENELRILADLPDDFVEFKFFLGIGREHAVFAQQGDELPEQVAIGKLGRGDLVELGNPLCGEMAETFELTARQPALTVLGENGHGDEVTLKGLQQRMPHDPELLILAGAAVGALQQPAFRLPFQ